MQNWREVAWMTWAQAKRDIQSRWKNYLNLLTWLISSHIHIIKCYFSLQWWKLFDKFEYFFWVCKNIFISNWKRNIFAQWWCMKKNCPDLNLKTFFYIICKGLKCSHMRIYPYWWHDIYLALLCSIISLIIDIKGEMKWI